MSATVDTPPLRNSGQWVAAVGRRVRSAGRVLAIVGDDADVSGTVADGTTLEQLAREWPGEHEDHGPRGTDDAASGTCWVGSGTPLVIRVASSLAGSTGFPLTWVHGLHHAKLWLYLGVVLGFCMLVPRLCWSVG